MINNLAYLYKILFASKGSLALKMDLIKDLKLITEQRAKSNIHFDFGKPYPILNEKNANAGTAEGHYFHQDLLVARRIFLSNPKKHVDIGSRVDGFVAHIASFRQIEVFDVRELPNIIPNVTFTQADLIELDKSLVSYCDSLSCLHALEHFGLGRYGDKVDYEGHIKGIKNLYDILKPGGKLYLSVPIGPQRIEFNAHRVFSIQHLLDCLETKFALDRFSFVDDNGALHENVPMTKDAIANNFGCSYGCGIFELTKKSS